MDAKKKPVIPERYKCLWELKRKIESLRHELEKMEQREQTVKNYGSSFLRNLKRPELPSNHYANKVALNNEIVRQQCAFISQLALLERDIAEIDDPKVRLVLSLRCVDLMPEKEAAKALGNNIGDSAIGAQLRRYFIKHNVE